MNMNKKDIQLKFNGINTSSTEKNSLATISSPAQFGCKLSPGGATYHQRENVNEPLLPEVPISHSPNAKKGVKPRANLTPLKVTHIVCNGHSRSSCSPSSISKDEGDENTNPIFSSMSEIELAMSDEDGQHGASSRLSGQISTNMICFNLEPSPIDTAYPPIFPVPPKILSTVPCTDDCCENITNKQCRWHYCILKFPEFILWQDEIRTVELKRSSSEWPGFNTKAMKHKNEDKEEFYVLVDKVKRDGKAAKSGLAVGDMILSVNGCPLQTVEKYQKSDLKKGALELRMQIQRPLQILDKAADVLNTRKKNQISKYDPANAKSGIGEPVAEPVSPDFVSMMMGKQNLEPIPLLPRTRSECKPVVTSHYLPQARVFLCGNRTLDFVRCMFGNLITVSEDIAKHSQTYHVSMEKLSDGSIKIDNSKAFSYMGEDLSNTGINVEVMAVLNDNFFHNLCSWMFTPKSIFILTFDTRKLSLANDAEMARLSTLANTILSHIPVIRENLQLFGMKPPEDDATLEEVRTLFYTSLATSLPEPKIIPLSSSGKNAIDNAQQDLFHLLAQISQKQKVLSITSNVIDRLIVNPNLIISRHELYHTLPERVIQSPEANHLFSCVEKDLRDTGNLMEVGNGYACDQKEFVIPCKFFEFLARLIQSMDNDTGSWASVSKFPGLLRELDLLEFVVRRVAPFDCPVKIIAFMKELNLLFPIRCHSRDSGFSEGATFLLPYYIEDHDFHIDVQNYQEIFLAKGINTIPVSAFFHLVSELSFQEQCVLSGIDSQTLFRICMDRTECVVCLDKGNSQIHVFTRRNQRLAGNHKQWLQGFVKASMSRHTAGIKVVSCEEDCSVLDQLSLSEDMENDRNERWTELREAEQVRLLEKPYMDLIISPRPQQELYEHMSISDKWEQWAGYLRLSMKEVELYRSCINKERTLSGCTFTTRYSVETRCSLRWVLSTLCAMSVQDSHCLEIATDLWMAAWKENSVWPPAK